jgi:ornithine carbamoyltransferase
MIRANRHDEVLELAAHADIPVINGLSDREHPFKILADIMTIEERLYRTEGVKVAWIGDGNNVCTSLILSTILTGMEVVVASPSEFAPNKEIVRDAIRMGAKVRIVTDPREAADGADVVMTDTWISMGQEEEIDRRRKIFMPYQVNMELMACAKPGAIVMHCLPAHRNWEITDDVIDSKASAVWDQAENRLHAQKALLVRLLA